MTHFSFYLQTRLDLKFHNKLENCPHDEKRVLVLEITWGLLCLRQRNYGWLLLQVVGGRGYSRYSDSAALAPVSQRLRRGFYFNYFYSFLTLERSHAFPAGRARLATRSGSQTRWAFFNFRRQQAAEVHWGPGSFSWFISG